MSGKFGLASGKVREMSGNFVLSSLYEPCEELKKVVQKNRRKASPISKKTNKTGPYPLILNKTGQKQKITVKQEYI